MRTAHQTRESENANVSPSPATDRDRRVRTAHQTLHIATDASPLEETQENQRLFPLEISAELRRNPQALAKFIAELVRGQPGSRVVLVADQFEELYTLSEERERGQFLQVLLNAVEVAPAFVLVLTLRADFYGQALSSALGKALQEYAPESLIPMEPEQLQRAIAKPAELYKVQLEAGLIQLIIDDLKSQPGRLPLLEFALTQLWKKQQGGWLTRRAYEEIGGVEAALARQAEEFYAVLDSAERKQLERVLIQLVHPGAGTEDTRRVATREDLKENWDLVARLASARLVVSDRAEAGTDTVEIVHEALLKSWVRLRGWIDDNREFRTWQDGLERDKEKWQQSGKQDGYLLREAPLLVARDWLQQRGEEISDSAREFIESSWALREAEIKREKRRQRNRILGLTVFSVFASALAVVAGVGWRQAEYHNQRAKRFQIELAYVRLFVEGRSAPNDPPKIEPVLNSQTEPPSEEQKSDLETEVVETIMAWLQAKKKMFAPPYDGQLAAELLTGHRYRETVEAIKWLRNNNAYYLYGVHKITSQENFFTNGRVATIEMEMSEERTLYSNGVVDWTNSGRTNHRYRYELRLVEKRWKIADSVKLN